MPLICGITDVRRTLVLMRHGEAEDTASGGDRFRVLTSEGKKSAAVAAAALRAKGIVTEKAYASDSSRTKQTSEQTGIAFEYRAELYLTGLTHIKAVVEPLPDDCKSVWLIGHNPGFSEAATTLTTAPVALRPAEVVVIGTNAASWREAFSRVGLWQLVAMIQH